MVGIVSHQDEQGRLAGLDETFADVEVEVAVVHVGAKTAPRFLVRFRVFVHDRVGPALEHGVEDLAISVVAYGLLNHGRRDAVRRGLDDAEYVRPADAGAHQVHLFNVEVVEQGDLVGGVGVPAVVPRYRRLRASGVALIHCDDSEMLRQRLDRIERTVCPELDGGTHASGGDKQHRESLAVDFVVDRYVAAVEIRHGLPPFLAVYLARTCRMSADIRYGAPAAGWYRIPLVGEESCVRRGDGTEVGISSGHVGKRRCSSRSRRVDDQGGGGSLRVRRRFSRQ